eukprot:scaffold19_cov114-Cylindrotheca_fusiformis.AAC.8
MKEYAPNRIDGQRGRFEISPLMVLVGSDHPLRAHESCEGCRIRTDCSNLRCGSLFVEMELVEQNTIFCFLPTTSVSSLQTRDFK